MTIGIFRGAPPLFNGDPIPYVPFPLVRGRGKIRKRGVTSLKLS